MKKYIITLSIILIFHFTANAQCGPDDIGNIAFVSLAISPPNSEFIATCRTMTITAIWEITDLNTEGRSFNNACHLSELQISFPSVLLGYGGSPTITASDSIDYFESIIIDTVQASVALSPEAIIPDNTQITFEISDIPMEMINQFYFSQSVLAQVSHTTVDQSSDNEDENLSFNAYTPSPAFDVTLQAECSSEQTFIETTASGGGGFNETPPPFYTYEWTGPNEFSSTDEDPFIVDDGNYIVTVSDTASRCAITDSIDVFPGNCFTLPVIYGDLQITSGDCSTSVSWKTFGEINNSHFNIFRSNDKSEFELIKVLPGNANSEGKAIYSFNDINLTKKGIYYYSIEQVDFNGFKTTFPIQATSVVCGNAEEYLIFPNPFKDEIIVKGLQDKDKYVDIINLTGQTVFTHFSKDGNRINLTNLLPGSYIAIVKSRNGNIFSMKKIVKM